MTTAPTFRFGSIVDPGFVNSDGSVTGSADEECEENPVFPLFLRFDGGHWLHLHLSTIRSTLSSYVGEPTLSVEVRVLGLTEISQNHNLFFVKEAW